MDGLGVWMAATRLCCGVLRLTFSWPKTWKVHQQRAAEKHFCVVYTTMWSWFSSPSALAASEKASAVGSLSRVVWCGVIIGSW